MSDELLTDDEHRAVELAGQLYNLLCNIVDDGPARQADLAECAASVHQIQRAVLTQAAARAYPDRYRLLGSTIQLNTGGTTR